MPQAVFTGKTRSVPKVVRINADDGAAIIYKNLGNGRRVPFLWATQVTMASGVASAVIASGIVFSDHKVSEGFVVALPNSDPGTGRVYVDKDTTANTVTLTITTAPTAETTWDVYVFLGDDEASSIGDTNQVFWHPHSITSS
jgi:anti-sigma-K factor RskA